MRKQYLASFEDEDEVSVITDTQATLAGQSARKLVVEDRRNEDRAPSRDITYLFEHDGLVYIIQGTYALANGTDFVKNQLDAAMNSFRLTE